MAQMLVRLERDGPLAGHREALSGRTEDEAAQLESLLARLIENLDRIAGAGASLASAA